MSAPTVYPTTEALLQAELPKSAHRYIARVLDALADNGLLADNDLTGNVRIVLDPGRPVTSKEDLGDGVTVERRGTRVVSIVVPAPFEIEGAS